MASALVSTYTESVTFGSFLYLDDFQNGKGAQHATNTDWRSRLDAQKPTLTAARKF